MSSDDGALNGSIFVIFVNFVLAILIIFLICCDNSPRHGYFYIQSDAEGYSVVMDDTLGHTTRITESMDLDDAKHTCDAFNATLGDKANK